MADLIKKIKIKKQDGTFSDYIPIGSDAANVETSDGESVQLKLNKKPYYYNTVADMKADIKLKAGDMAITLGYYESNDGGAGEYKIVNNNTLIDDGGSVHNLNNGLKAKLLESRKNANPLQWGIKQDDNSAINSNGEILSYLIKNNYKIKFPSGNFYIANVDLTGVTLVFISGQSERLYDTTYNTTKIYTLGNDFCYKKSSGEIIFYVKNLNIASSNYTGVCFGLQGNTSSSEANYHIQDCTIEYFQYGCLSPAYASETVIRDSAFKNNKYGIYIALQSNRGIFDNLLLNFNLYGIRASGKISNIHLGIGSPITRDENVLGYGINCNYGANIDNIYQESYGANTNQYTIFKLGSYSENLSSGNFWHTIKNTVFPSNYGNVANETYNIEISGDTSLASNWLNLENCEVDKLFIKHHNVGMLRGIVINGKQSFANNQVAFFNKTEQNLSFSKSGFDLTQISINADQYDLVTFNSSVIPNYDKYVGVDNSNYYSCLYDETNRCLKLANYGNKKKVHIVARINNKTSNDSFQMFIRYNESTTYGDGFTILSPIFKPDKYGAVFINWTAEINNRHGLFQFGFARKEVTQFTSEDIANTIMDISIKDIE